MAKPIRLPRMPLDMAPGSPEATEFLSRIVKSVALIRLMKIVVYARQQGFDVTDLNGTGLALAVSVAIDAGVPGFQTIADDSSTVGRARTRNNPDDMQFLFNIVEFIRQANWADTDKAACAIWAECETPELIKTHDRAKRAKTLANLVSRFRAAGNQSTGLQITTAKQVEALERLMAKIQVAKLVHEAR